MLVEKLETSHLKTIGSDLQWSTSANYCNVWTLILCIWMGRCRMAVIILVFLCLLSYKVNERQEKVCCWSLEPISRVNALIIERNRDLFPGELRRLERILVFRRRITSSGLFFQAQISTKISTTSLLLALKHNANVGIDSYKDLKIIVMVVHRFCPLFWLNLLETHCFFNFPRSVTL